MKFIFLGEKQDNFGPFENDAMPSHDGRRHNGRKAQWEKAHWEVTPDLPVSQKWTNCFGRS